MTPLDRFIAPARTDARLWRTLAGVALLVGLIVGSMMALAAGLRLIPALTVTGPALTLAALFSFTLVLAALFAVVRLWHGRALGTIFGPGTTRDFARVVVPLLGVSAGIFALSMGDEALIPGLDAAVWLRLLPFACLALLIQVTAEEAVFRGYLLQQLGARFRARWAWLVLPSVIFGALHYDPATYGAYALPIVALTTLYGLALADLTARTGNLGPAIALHFANNFSALLLMSLQEPDPVLSGLALYQWPMDDEVMRIMLLTDPLMTLIFWLVARLRLRV